MGCVDPMDFLQQNLRLGVESEKARVLSSSTRRRTLRGRTNSDRGLPSKELSRYVGRFKL